MRTMMRKMRTDDSLCRTYVELQAIWNNQWCRIYTFKKDKINHNLNQ